MRIRTRLWKLTLPLFLFFGLTSGLLPPTASASPASWWDTSWTFRSTLYFNTANITDDLVDFPVRVELTTTNFDFNKAKNKGEDVRFIDQDNATVLPYEIEWWDKMAKSAVIWVKVPRINANSSDTDYINLYYGNTSAANAQSKPKVWGDWLTISDGKSLGNWNYGHGVSLSLDNTGSAFLIKSTVASPEAGTEYTADYNPADSWNISEPSANINFSLSASHASTAYTWVRLYAYDISGNYRYWNLAFTANTSLNARKPLRSGDGQSANPPDLTAVDYIRVSFKTKDTQAFTYNIGGIEVVWGAIGVWHFNEMAGNEASDSTRYATAGVLKGGPAWSNYALDFDGKGSYVNLNYPPREQYLASEFSTPGLTHQEGVAADGTYIYVADLNILYKYDLAGKLIKKSAPISPMGFGGITYYNGLIYAATWLQSPKTNKIYVYNQDLVKTAQYDISKDLEVGAGAIGYFNGHFYVGESDWMPNIRESRIVKYTTDFRFVAEFRLPVKLSYGIQGIEYIPVKDSFQVNGHGVEFFTINTAFDKSTIIEGNVIYEPSAGLQDIAHLNSAVTLYNDRAGERILFLKNNPPSIPLLDDLITKEYTVEGWFNVEGSEGQRRAIFETDVSFAISAEIHSGNFLRYAVEGTGVIVNTDVFPKMGDWNSVAVTYQENNFAKIYYNGKELAGFAGRPVGALAPRNFLRIGTYRGANDRWFDGLIDEIRLYNVAKSASWLLADEKNRHGTLVRVERVEHGPGQGFRFGCASAR